MEAKLHYEAPALEAVVLQPHARLLDTSQQQRILYFADDDGEIYNPGIIDGGDF